MEVVIDLLFNGLIFVEGLVLVFSLELGSEKLVIVFLSRFVMLGFRFRSRIFVLLFEEDTGLEFFGLLSVKERWGKRVRL